MVRMASRILVRSHAAGCVKSKLTRRNRRFSSLQLRPSRSGVYGPIQGRISQSTGPAFRSITVDLTTVLFTQNPAQFDYREEEGVQGCGLNSQTNAQRLTAQHCRQVVTTSLLGHHACTCIMRRTSHSTARKEGKKGGIRNKPNINQL